MAELAAEGCAADKNRREGIEFNGGSTTIVP
jgi:hypothetical protein